ncbi:MAG: N-acetyl-gamma-glutamyl-phosphate reductase [Ignavibacteria bacterium]|jgi:N-acetyl-gamma-glutamyl-phosphate reductase|nr:N-acetyl-gamma-glutamyl-phosphate reductase [Ignavibacteria bacterium]MCU7500520.1 N-acetyl-gamma-glutamyl-phosphate reductase [Ignavibacteria bacterium]MCU7514068.1 N-acetyl-gamma-glutamyl-phosphate reductase [Ignavibacteria bacterium]MCU7519595.1 N-acetyl-gamma-glutamyl-phosphate reductase [Ignavibacteria bacterium]MCU7525678.1 N-acetyl-gamma-glutamyl-phosphate reductase [Ignavibacteria bacterium]
MISIGIIGGSGYAGKKLVEILSLHPFVDNFTIYGNSTAGQSLYSVFPDLYGKTPDSVILPAENVSYDHDLYFLALPHGEALKYVPELIAKNKKIIDIGGDYRLDTAELYEKWYKLKHTSPNLLKEKLYGLADFIGDEYKGVSLVANPGCYPTATLLSLLPLASKFGGDILSASTIAYSGTSGAGKSAKTEMLMSEMDGNVRAYNVNGHRHQPEVLQMLNKNGFNSPYSFTTHLLPAATGIYATSSVHLKKDISEKDVLSEYKNIYGNSNFVRLRNVPPNLSWVVGTNFCDINVSVSNRVVVVTSTIDNLVKGAAGQAVQNMNKLFNFDERLGILHTGEKNVSIY